MDAKKVKTPKPTSKKTSERKKNNTSKQKTISVRSNSSEKPRKNEIKTPISDGNQSSIKRVILNEAPSTIKDNKLGLKLDLIDKQLEKSEEILYNQNKTLSKIKEISGRINYLDKNFESIYYKNDIENFNSKLASNDENLMNILSNLKSFNNQLDNLKNLQDQNRNLKYKLDIVEVEKDDKNLYYQNKLDTFEAQFGGEIHDLFNFLKNMNLTVPFNYPNINPRNMDENQIALFFAFLKQMIKSLKYKYDEKEKDLKFIQYDKNNLLEELSSLKKRYEMNNNFNYEADNNMIHVEEGKNEELPLNKTLNLSDNWRTKTDRREPKFFDKEFSKNLNYGYSNKY